MSRSVAAISAKSPPRCTVPASCASRLVQGTPPFTAKSTLNAPGPYRKRRKARATLPGNRSPRMSAIALGARSNIVTSVCHTEPIPARDSGYVHLLGGHPAGTGCARDVRSPRRRRRAQPPPPPKLTNPLSFGDDTHATLWRHRPKTAAAVAEFGGLDGLVNNAGIEIAKPITELSEDEFTRVFDINVTGTFRCTKAAIPVIAAAGGGAIVIQSRGHQPDQDGGARIASRLRSRQRNLSRIRRHRFGQLAEGRIRTSTGIAQLRCADGAGPGRLCDSRRHRPPHRVPGVGTIALLHRRCVCSRWWFHGIDDVTTAGTLPQGWAPFLCPNRQVVETSSQRPRAVEMLTFSTIWGPRSWTVVNH